MSASFTIRRIGVAGRYTNAIMCLRRLPAPEGQLKVAQQFTAGYGGLRSIHPSTRRDD